MTHFATDCAERDFQSANFSADVHPDDGMEAHTGGGAGPSQGPGLHPVHFMAEQVPVPDHLGAPVSVSYFLLLFNSKNLVSACRFKCWLL